MRARCPHRQSQQGFTLVELVIIIVVLGIAAVTLTLVAARTSEMSARMLRDQQALDLATSILNEVRSMPFSYCDPHSDPAKLTTATSTTGCNVVENMGAEAGQTRLGATRFDNVNDYNGLTLSGASLSDYFGNSLAADLPSMSSCVVNISITSIAFVAITAASNEAQRISVRVSNCAGQSAPITQQAVRVRYAPNSL